MRYYAGIGSRETPPDVLALMTGIAYALATIAPVEPDYRPDEYPGWALRSGGADGADSAFERGAMMGMDSELLEPWPEIFLPWPRFNGRAEGPDYPSPTDAAYEIAAAHHPAWDRLSRGGRALHARNVHQVLGPGIGASPPSEFVVCWTLGGKGGGGTGQAIRVACAYSIPVYDLARPGAREEFAALLERLELDCPA